MKTIKTKLFFMFISLMIAFVLCSILLNTLLLEDYYIYANRSIFRQIDNQINGVYNRGPREVAKLIDVVDRVNGISCAIYDKDQVFKYSSYANGNSPPGRLPSEIEQLINSDKRFDQKGFAYGTVQTPDQSRDLAFVSRLGDGGFLVMKKPLQGVAESSAIANQFFMMSSLVIILLGSLLIYWFAKKITRPIVDMSGVAEAIANLDFTQRVEVDSQDEIGNLGRSINLTSQTLSESIAALREDLERRKQLVRNLSHELKTPIGIIKGYAEGLKYGVVNEPEKTNRYCEVIAAECDRMDVMIKDLLKLSLLESGTMVLNRKQIPIKKLFNALMERFSPILDEKDVQMQINFANGLEVYADYDLMEQALSNFILNAIHYIDEDKTLQMKAESTVAGVKLSVFNSGMPIPEKDKEKLWDVYYKADRARSREYGGHGLGLSIVKAIAQIHSGSCGLENSSNGVLFYIEIPKNI